MKPRYVIGSGTPPRYISHFVHHRGRGGEIHLDGGDMNKESIHFSSQSDLLQKCRSFAERRFLFFTGDRNIGPSYDMRIWQGDGSIPISFLELFWKKPGEWTIYEIIPETMPPWQIVELSEILDYGKKAA